MEKKGRLDQGRAETVSARDDEVDSELIGVSKTPYEQPAVIRLGKIGEFTLGSKGKDTADMKQYYYD